MCFSHSCGCSCRLLILRQKYCDGENIMRNYQNETGGESILAGRPVQQGLHFRQTPQQHEQHPRSLPARVQQIAHDRSKRSAITGNTSQRSREQHLKQPLFSSFVSDRANSLRFLRVRRRLTGFFSTRSFACSFSY